MCPPAKPVGKKEKKAPNDIGGWYRNQNCLNCNKIRVTPCCCYGASLPAGYTYVHGDWLPGLAKYMNVMARCGLLERVPYLAGWMMRRPARLQSKLLLRHSPALPSSFPGAAVLDCPHLSKKKVHDIQCCGEKMEEELHQTAASGDRIRRLLYEMHWGP